MRLTKVRPMTHPEMINLDRRLFVDQFGFEYPIVAMYDGNAQECDCPDAVAVVAGVEGRWYVIDLEDFGL